WMEVSGNLNHNYVGTEHILLGLLREAEGVAAQVLMNLGLKLPDVREEVLNLLGHDIGADIRGSTKYSAGYLQPNQVPPISRELTAEILNVLREKYESHYRV